MATYLALQLLISIALMSLRVFPDGGPSTVIMSGTVLLNNPSTPHLPSQVGLPPQPTCERVLFIPISVQTSLSHCTHLV